MIKKKSTEIKSSRIGALAQEHDIFMELNVKGKFAFWTFWLFALFATVLHNSDNTLIVMKIQRLNSLGEKKLLEENVLVLLMGIFK